MGVGKTFSNGESSGLAGFVESDEADLDGSPIFEFVGDATHDFFAGLLWRASVAHEFDNHCASCVFDNGFAPTGGCGSTDIVVDVKSCSDNWGVTDSAMQFHPRPASCAGAGEIAIGVASDHTDGIMILDIDFWKFVVFLRFTLLPCGQRFFGKEYLFLETLFEGEF